MSVINNIQAWLSAYWFWLVIGVLGLIVIYFLISKQKGLKYHDQIKENKETFTKELELNPTEIKFMQYKDRVFKVLGERWIGRISVEKPKIKQNIRQEISELDIKEQQLKMILSKIKDYEEPETIAHKFLVKTKYLDLKVFRLYLGKPEIIYLQPNDFNQVDSVTMRINDRVRLMYERGVYIPMRPKMIDLVSEETERVMKDLGVNATGKQTKDLSRLEIPFSQKEIMKEKDIEAEKEKDQARRF